MVAALLLQISCATTVSSWLTHLRPFLLADLTGLDLREGDKRWLAILEGVDHEYDGPAVAPKHLSLLEKLIGYGKTYNPSKAAKSPSEGNGSGHDSPKGLKNSHSEVELHQTQQQ